MHRVRDEDPNPKMQAEAIAKQWIASFEGAPEPIEIEEVRRAFEGKALVRIRATVAHDSYERLVEVPCSSLEHHVMSGRSGIARVPDIIENGSSIGVKPEHLFAIAAADPAIAEFCRFYKERQADEVARAKTTHASAKNLKTILRLACR